MRSIVLAIIIAPLLAGSASAVAANSSVKAEVSGPARTGKERLSEKGSDEQRVDDCKVPLARRTRERPSDCQRR